MSSSGLKLRDTRELLASPDHKNTAESILSSPTGSLEDQVVSISTKQLSTAEVVTSMSPSLAMAMANANSSHSNQKDNLSTESAAATRNACRESEPIPKKRRILDATEAAQEHKEPDIQKSTSEDILARACFAVGIGDDIAESVVEEPLPNHQEHNGEIQRLPPNYPYIRGVRPPPPGMPIPSRHRHPEDIRIHHQFHPAFRPSGDGSYGMEVRSLYGPAYAVPRRMPIHPGEPHGYYAMPRFPNRYPYVGPPGSIPPSMTRPPIMRAPPPNGPHERHPSSPHAPQGYQYDPHHIPRPAVHHGTPPPTSPLHHDTRMELSEAHHARPAGSEVRPLHPRHHEVSYRLPAPHNLGTIPAVLPEQLSPTLRGHPYPRQGPIPIRPKLHVNTQAHLEDPRAQHAGVHEAYIAGLSHGIHSQSGSPHPRSPLELSCQNPFQIPDSPESSNVVLVSKSPHVPSPQDASTLKAASAILERNETQISVVSPIGNVIEQRERNTTNVKPFSVSRNNSQNFLQSRRLREPPEPCVELIPIPLPSQEEENYKDDKPNQKVQHSAPISNPIGKNSKQRKSLKASQSQRKPNGEEHPPLTPLRNSDHSVYSEVVLHEQEQHHMIRSLKECLEAPKENSVIPFTVPQIDTEVVQKVESTHNGPKRSFRKRWLDKQDASIPKRSTRLTSAKSDAEKFKPPEEQGFLAKSDQHEKTTVIVLDDEENETKDADIQKPTAINIRSKIAGTEVRLLGPGQLHCLHSSIHLNQMRSASEPPIGTNMPPNSMTASHKRPASVPSVGQQLQHSRVPNESQNKAGHISLSTILENVKETREEDNDTAFINRLKLVLNDLISVPEATNLQHLTCPVDELLASLVKRRGALPSVDPNPRQRLRQDFLVLVKLCMPHDLLEAWGWNKSSPEEILDELIKVTNNGVDGNKGNARFNSMKDHRPTPSESLHHSTNHPNLPPSNHITSSPHPLVPISLSYSNSSPIHPVSVPSSHSDRSPSHLVSVLNNHPGLSPRDPVPVPSNHPALSPTTHPISHPLLSPTHAVPAPPTHPAVSPTHPVPAAPTHPVLSPNHPVPAPSTHSVLSPTHPGPAPPTHPVLSPTHPVPAPPTHPVLSPTHPGPVPLTHPVLSPTHPVQVPSSHSSSSPIHQGPIPSSHPASSLHHPHPTTHSSTHPAMSPRQPVPPLTHHPVYPPYHPGSHPSKHPPSVSLHPLPGPRPSNHPHMPPHHTTSIPSYHSPPSSGQHTNKWPSSRHSVPPLSRQTTLPSTQSDTAHPQEDHLEDDVFSPTSRDPPCIPTSRNPLTASHVHPRAQSHPHDQSQENCSSSNQVSQAHVVYTHSTTAYTHSPSNAHPTNIPVTVLHYSHLPQHAQDGPHHGQHSSPHYVNAHTTHTVRNPPHYPRGPYNHPYPYAYYPNSPHRPPHRLPYRAVCLPVHSHNLPRHPNYHHLHNIPRNLNTTNAVRLVAQPPVSLAPNDWNGSEGQRIETSTAIKPPA